MNEISQVDEVRFLIDLHARIFKWCYNYQDRNWDAMRFGLPTFQSFWSRINHKCKILLNARGWAFRCFDVDVASAEIALVPAKAKQSAEAYALFVDVYSRQVFAP